MLYRSWSDGDVIALIATENLPPLTYDPDGNDPDPAISAQQHLSVQKVEQIIEQVMLKSYAEGRLRCVTLGEFFAGYADTADSSLHTAISPLKELFVSFNPASRPVLWRLLIVQTYLYRELSGHLPSAGGPDRFDQQEQELLTSTNNALATEDPFRAASVYLTTLLSWRELSTPPPQALTT
jgi:hypothetical protein